MRKIDGPLAFAGLAVLLIVLAAFFAPLIWPEANHGTPTASQKEAYDWISERLSSAAFWTAIFTGILTWSTIGLWRQTRRLAEGADAQAGDIKRQLQIVQDDFVSTHRPWIRFTARIAPKGVTYDSLGMHIHMIFDCANSGSTPGIGVTVNADAFQGTAANPTYELDKLEAICRDQGAPAASNTYSHHVSGATIFPGNSWRFEKEFLIARRDIEAIKPTQVRPQGTAPKQLIIPAVAGCVDYGFPFGPLEPHQTRFILYIGKPSSTSSERLLPLVVEEGDMKPEGLRIVRSNRLRAFAVT